MVRFGSSSAGLAGGLYYLFTFHYGEIWIIIKAETNIILNIFTFHYGEIWIRLQLRLEVVLMAIYIPLW